MKKIKTALGLILFLIGFICSFGQKEDGGPAPLWTLGSVALMIVGGKMYASEMKDGDE